MGVIPVYALDDWARAMQLLMPRGRAWPRDADALQPQVIRALVANHARQATAAANEVEDSFPASAVTSLADWEAALGLPDPCAGPDPTIALRQTHVVARLTQLINPSIPDLVAYAAALGFAVTVTEYAPARAGILRAGQPCNGPAWAFAYLVTAPAIDITYFRAGQSRAGEPLSNFSSSVLLCELQRISPAHLILMIGYTGPFGVALWDAGVWDRDTWGA